MRSAGMRHPLPANADAYPKLYPRKRFLQEHTSYFMAELKQLQQIIRFLQNTTSPSLILIDEILRGTQFRR